MKTLLLVLIGACIGTWGSLCGIGGGIFAVPIFHYLLKQPLEQAIANSLVLVAVMTSGGTLVELLRPDCAIQAHLLAALIATSWLGTQVGVRIAARVSVRTLKRAFALLLAAVALELLWSAPLASAPTAWDWTSARLAWALVLGFFAGLVAPLFGIGGGLIAVPGLLYGFPEIGYQGARGTSTAMSTFNAWQSVWLQRRRSLVVAHQAWPTAVGAFAGSYVGVWLSHRPEIATPAQRLIALTLLLVSLRFAFDRKD